MKTAIVIIVIGSLVVTSVFVLNTNVTPEEFIINLSNDKFTVNHWFELRKFELIDDMVLASDARMGTSASFKLQSYNVAYLTDYGYRFDPPQLPYGTRFGETEFIDISSVKSLEDILVMDCHLITVAVNVKGIYTLDSHKHEFKSKLYALCGGSKDPKVTAGVNVLWNITRNTVLNHMLKSTYEDMVTRITDGRVTIPIKGN